MANKLFPKRAIIPDAREKLSQNKIENILAPTEKATCSSALYIDDKEILSSAGRFASQPQRSKLTRGQAETRALQPEDHDSSSLAQEDHDRRSGRGLR
jgi:hypothetical protein